MIHLAITAGVGFLVGVFCPAVARKIKSWFSKEATAAVTDVTKKL